MRVELRLPNLDLPGVPITACTWHANVGDRVIEGDRLLEVLAGDAIIDLPAPATGKLLERKVQPDDALATGQVLAVIAAEN
jgi:pyruvate/2-oxoglutarate dehydrogenase complex dihydrolipoamide acyltransferase (E2) component